MNAFSERGLFDGAGPRVRATLASAPFFDVLVRALLAALGKDDPFALADALILLPNRRAAHGLMEAFARALGGAALLPTIRPLGDLDEDDPDVWGGEPLALGAPAAIDPLRRRLELAALIRKRDEAEGGVADPVRALAFADELVRLLDSAAATGPIEWSRLDDLVEGPAFAAHWRQSAQFLQIITQYWPRRLAADGLVDAAERRARLLGALAASWRAAPPETPIVIAGSTGSIAATRELMGVVAGLPRGLVVLPGLDADLDEAAWARIDEGHPQFALKETIAALGVARGAVPLLGVDHDVGAARARRILVREALVPADATASWVERLTQAGGARLAEEGAAGLTLHEAASEEEEASLIALLLRETYERAGRTAALVTPDARLAHRVEQKLARWGVRPLMTQAPRLETTGAGVFIGLIARLALDDGDPIALAGLLAQPLAALSLAPEDKSKGVHALERAALRGPRRHTTLTDLARRAPAGCADLLKRLMAALAPLRAVRDPTDLAAFADALVAASEAAASSIDAPGPARLWVGVDGLAAARALRGVCAYGAELGEVTKRDAARALTRIMSEQESGVARDGDPRVAILGPLEARLQRPDLVILGGLNEGVWPAPPHEDAFLSRAMRAALGLASPDVRMGLAAHDFAQLASAGEVALTRSLRRAGAPTLASRWLWRLKTLLRAAGREHLLAPAPARDARAWARALDAPRARLFIKPPSPRPPAASRLTRISVTEVETLIRNPYAVYARRILGLETLDPIGAPIDARLRGTAAHAALERYGGEGASALADMIDKELAALGMSAATRHLERARLEAACVAMAAWFEEPARKHAKIYVERPGRLALGVGVSLTARADRIECDETGAASIIDFKTGAPPSDKEVAAGLAPQLTLEAAMLEAGVFDGAPAARARDLIYWRFGGAGAGPRAVNLSMGAREAGQAALARLESLLEEYQHPDQPFLCKPRAQFIKPYEEYDALARRKEWADAEESA